MFVLESPLLQPRKQAAGRFDHPLKKTTHKRVLLRRGVLERVRDGGMLCYSRQKGQWISFSGVSWFLFNMFIGNLDLPSVVGTTKKT